MGFKRFTIYAQIVGTDAPQKILVEGDFSLWREDSEFAGDSYTGDLTHEIDQGGYTFLIDKEGPVAITAYGEPERREP